MGNKKYTLTDVCKKIFSGGTPSTQNKLFWNGNIKWLSSGETSQDFIYDTEKKITELGTKTSTKLAKQNSVVIATAGQGFTRGQVSYLMNDMYINQSIISLEVNETKINSLYLYYNLKGRYDELRQLSDGTSTRGSLSGYILKKLDITIPTLVIQNKIVEILYKIDSKIEINNKINNNLLEQVFAIYKSIFENSTAKQNYKHGIVADIAAEIICGKTPSTKNPDYYGYDVPFITIPDMHNQVYMLETSKSLSKLGAESQTNKFLEKNTICVSCIGTAGLVSLVQRPSQTNQQINSIIPKDGISPFFVYCLMTNLSETINRYGQCGSTIVNLNKELFSKLEVIIPNQLDMKLFNDLVTPMFDSILNNQIENQKLISLRDSLLPKLMSGEIDVDSIELDI